MAWHGSRESAGLVSFIRSSKSHGWSLCITSCLSDLVWRWRASARFSRTPVTWNALPGFCGRCRPANTCTRTRACSRRRRSWRSTAATSKNSTDCSSLITSRRTTTRNFSHSGSKVTTSKPRSCVEDRSVLSGNTVSDGNSRCHARYGTERKRRTASKRSLELCLETGTHTTRILRRERRENWPKRPAWRPPRCLTGSKTGARETAPPSPRTGQFRYRFLFVFTARRVCIARTMPWQDVSPPVCHTPVLCLNGYTYPQNFFTIG